MNKSSSVTGNSIHLVIVRELLTSNASRLFKGHIRLEIPDVVVVGREIKPSGAKSQLCEHRRSKHVYAKNVSRHHCWMGEHCLNPDVATIP